MKDLTYYYKSPPKPIQDESTSKNAEASTNREEKASTSEGNSTTTSKTCDVQENEKSKGYPPCSEETVNINVKSKENKENTTSRQHKHKKKSKKSRKHSDPTIRSIADLFDSSLNIVSPNTSRDEDKNSSLTGEAEKNSSRTHSSNSSQSGNNDRRPSSRNANKKPSISRDADKNSSAVADESKKHQRRSSSDFETPKTLKKLRQSDSEKQKTDESASELSKKREAVSDRKEINVCDVSSQSHGKSGEKSKHRKEKVKSGCITKHTKTEDLKASNKSRNASKNEVISDRNTEGDKSKKASIEIKETNLDNKSSDSNTETAKTKINAFQFLMESRHRSIGQNLEGKDSNSESLSQEEKERKEKRHSQKQILEKLAEKKTDTKRKRKEEEEKDLYINYQLEKRAKRLKKLLQMKPEVDPKIEPETPRRSLRKRIVKPVIMTDSESDEGSEVEVAEVTKIESKKLPKGNKNENSKVKNVNVEKNSSNNVKKCEENSKNECNETKNLKISNGKQNGLLSFLGVTNKLKKDGGSSKDIRNDFAVKENTGNNKIIQTKKHSQLEFSHVDLAVECENANLSMPLKESEIKECVVEVDINTSKNSADPTIDLSSVDNTNTVSNGSYNYYETSCSQDTADHHRTPKTRKHKKKRTIEDHLIGRSPSHWKMRIRLTSDDEDLSLNDIIHGKSSDQNALENCDVKNTKEPNRTLGESKESKTSEVTEIMLSSDSDEDLVGTSCKAEESKKNMKIAPVFLRATPKPKPDPKIIEAKRQFLMSGVPENLKKKMEKQTSSSVEEIEFNAFPSIQHVQQKSPSCKFWDMPPVDLCLNTVSPFEHSAQKLMYEKLTSRNLIAESNISENTEKIKISKQIIDKIKKENTAYPVYKTFKCLYEKSGLKSELEGKKKADDSDKKTKKKRRSVRKKKKCDKLDESVETVENSPEKVNPSKFVMWTEKYKPLVSTDIIGNAKNVSQLKKWLEKWVEPVEDVSSKKKRKRHYSSSESDFEFTDGDSRDSACDPKNTLILKGPNGSGKTAAVYAVCNELGMNVLELNASSKRTGKWLLQELQEATQSHQVMKGESASLSQFLKIEKTKDNSQSDSQQSSQNKICVLLVEDIDIIFEQDEGFLSALSQLIMTSKRPIILTTADDTSQNISKFLSHPVISFNALTAYSSATWLQILCLIEGVAVDKQSLGLLLDKNNGDIRKTLLQLQFWVQSGGDLRKSKNASILMVPEIKQRRTSSDDDLAEDEGSNLSFINDDGLRIPVEYQTNCLDSFEVISHSKLFNIPYNLGASRVWWNLPNILSLKSFDDSENSRNEKVGDADDLSQSDEMLNVKNKKVKAKKTLKAICNIYDSLILTDILTKKKDCMVDLEPCPRQWDCVLKDSLEFGENFQDYSYCSELTDEMCHSSMDSSIDLYRKSCGSNVWINLGLPSTSDKRWRAKQHLCEDILQDALSLSSYLDRRAVSLDLMPTLRHIGRSEMARASNNMKRGNRFNNYLRGLGIDGGENSYKLVCNVLNVDKFK